MKNNKSIIFWVFLFVTILGVFLVTSVCATEKPIILKYGEFEIPTDLAGKLAIILQEEIAKKTDGRVNLKIYWAGSLLKGEEILRGVEEGVVDMGNINQNYYPNQLPLSQVFNVIPRGPSSYKSQMMIYEKVMEQVPEWKDEFLAHNQLSLLRFTKSDRAIASVKPIKSLEDFKNQKMRSSSRWILAMIGAGGATPVSVPWPDCYMALQTGTIDAMLCNFDSLLASKLVEPAKNILLCEGLWAESPFHITINLDTWNKLPEDIQSQIMEALDSTTASYSKLLTNLWDTCIEEAEKMGCVINKMPTEDMEKWLSSPVVEEIGALWIKEGEDKGMENASKILEKIKSIVAEVVEKGEMN
ncbi:Solute-binding protein [subsurface metagenome]